jgi:hypothetical protein
MVRRFRLPPEFTVDTYNVFVYSGSEELATNVSPNRAEVSEDEALQFLILRHMQRNKGASLEPQIARELRPNWPRAELAPDWENTKVTLHITSDGKVDETGVARTIGSALNAELAAAVQKMLFLPALTAGKPVSSSRTFALGELFQTPLREMQLTSN